jgi:predicted glutamine amidotransferase
MCVVAIKNKGVAFPNDDSIKAMWDANSDGAGFMYALDNKVFIEKGFMKLSDLNGAVALLEKRLKKKDLNINDIPMVLHFRITTHGGTTPHLTHPFPISSQEKHLKALDLTCDLGLVHNGIITSVPTQAGLSDTAIYIANVLTPLANLKSDFYMSNEGKAIMENTIGASKFAFLDKDGNIETIGDFKKGTKNNTDDILFSNLSHEWDKTTFAMSNATNYGYSYNFDYDVDEYSMKDFVKRIPMGYIVVNKKKFFESEVDFLKHAKTIKENDYFYIDREGLIYTPNSKMVLKENYFYDTIVKIDDKTNMYVEVDIAELDNVKTQEMEVVY